MLGTPPNRTTTRIAGMKAARAMEGEGKGKGEGEEEEQLAYSSLALLQYNNSHIRIDKIYS